MSYIMCMQPATRRPGHKHVGTLYGMFSGIPLMAPTAIATHHVQQDKCPFLRVTRTY